VLSKQSLDYVARDVALEHVAIDLDDVTALEPRRHSRLTLALLARAGKHGLTYAGSAFIALTGVEKKELNARLQVSKLERCPIPRLRFPDAQWVAQVTARVRHLAGASISATGRCGVFLANLEAIFNGNNSNREG
jgi:hypothetical protein